MPADSGYYDQGYHTNLLRRELADDAYYRLRAQVARRLYFSSLPTPVGRVLEYGCGIGQNIALLEDAVGYDPSPEARQACRDRGLAVVDSPEQLPIGGFQVVLCRHVLEHVESPLDVLRELLNYLAPEGLLILVLPQERQRRVALAGDVHQHLFAWTFQTINNLALRAGGVPMLNRVEPMFGPLTYRLLRPVLRTLGFRAYYLLARLAGRVFGDQEMVIHITRARSR